MNVQQIGRRIAIRFLAGAVVIAGLCSRLYADPKEAPSAASPGGAQAPPNAPAGQAPPPEQVPTEQAAAAAWLEKAFDGQPMPESVQMLVAIARGSQMGPGEGWFGPGQSRYDWKWLAGMAGAEATAEIAPEQLHGPKEFFDRLDRNRDGRISASDLDWSDRNPYVQQFYLVSRIMRRMNAKGDGRLTRDEVLAFFDRAASGREFATSADLAETLLAGFGSAPGANDGPTADTLVRGLFRGEIGSLNSGPALNATAPDFSLKTQDGKQTIRLGELRGEKPTVLVFGNFTCGPFRSTYPLVDELCKRYQDRANFLAVYVREAHPTNGWRMESNDAAGVELAQPATYDERVAVAQRCQAKLNYSMPLVVDEINDPVGNAYSGMPARLYLIDSDGKVAYKSGRGPFGFKPRELEQALVMLLLEQQFKSAAPIAETTE
ncbi:MAG TPA: deiodinase family protein [Pirellulales bacterium]|nr:deiodinase family protein [Pirellulales bacterium]